MEQEILSPIPLLTPRGALTEEGWARRPYWQFSANDTKKALLKQADRYIITDPENGLTITVDMLILGLRRFFSIAFVDMKNGHIGRAEAEGISRGKDALLPDIRLRLAVLDGEQHIYLNDEDVSALIRTEQVGMAASAVGANPAVRAFLLDLQRDMAKTGNILMDGRDIGTVILPNATVKIFLTASCEARARRRWLEYQAAGRPDSYEEVLADVKQRDEQDSGRAAAPLRRAEDAVLLDTSDMDLGQSLAAMKRFIIERVWEM